MQFGAYSDPKPGPVLGWPPNVVFYMLCAAAFLCCMPMALPQTHLIAFCSDLGILPTHGAAMLSVVLGTGFLCRQLWGLFSDRMGACDARRVFGTQATALSAFLMTQDEIGLFTVSALFGVGFSGLVPAYVLTMRQYYPVRDARWRVPTLLLFSGSGWQRAPGREARSTTCSGITGQHSSPRSSRTCSILRSWQRSSCGSIRGRMRP